MDSANPMTTVSRRSKPKTRTGCLTCNSFPRACRFRRVKCDEQKPSCLRCLSTKRICEGYPIISRPTIAITNHLADEERRAFSYFRSRTAHRIFGEQDANEWVPVILQIAHIEPAVRHGITALASLHESLEPVNNQLTWLRQTPQDRSLSAQMLALRHYNHAIQSLRSESIVMSSRPDITMILCILFLCFEQFRSGDAACLVHMTAGLKLIDWWRSRTDNYTKLKEYSRPTLEFMNEKITPIIQRLRVQFSLCMDSRHRWGRYGVTYGLPPTIPTCYSSFDAARRDFDRSMSYMFSVLENNQVTYHQEPARDPITILRQWKNSLDASNLFSQTTHLQGCSRRLLELYYHVSIVITGTYYTEIETAFDKYLDQFQAIVDLAEQIAIDWQHATKEYSLMFSFDLGLTPPMFLVASRCRHPDIRRKAVRLMLESPFYHGV
ncbi:hypothetical protein BO94DRAFT_544082 [Aspergillus sclerotioniger CBS 115572]|uniref:Zn(2)-C6 fungal-type domain-containing protein n=1 Tax=Aspergillus sclerotioniger CBS 115572 TaxID=1450535 RepID=A0A317X395_9EURO|nr:hypothetical protein BO94DRAFT_544082 [Aspergillus sclerotioniger CBS 115572]PWY93033.1 hypothetical protein BO94DRAFT_544082 [Aspergillus sclerotioniger CBS 115572]